MGDGFDMAWRWFMGVSGVVMFLHFVAMAGYSGRGPWFRFALLPVLVGFGLAIALCGLAGLVDLGARVMALSVAPLLALYLAVWGMGSHVSEIFEQRARERDLQRARYYYGEAAAGVESLGPPILTDSGLIALQEAEERAARRRSGANHEAQA